jgi:tetratricopeptide (TPR) repeat protein
MNKVPLPSDVPRPALPVTEALVVAERHRAEGRLEEAERLCCRVLDTHPNLPDAEALLGLIAHQGGRLAEAIDHMRRATELAPRVALHHANLGEMLRVAGRPRLAVKAARRALAIEPKLAMAQNNLGVALFELGDFDAAVAAYREAIAARPDFAEPHSNLGNALHALRRYDEAVAAFRRAIELKHDFADAFANLGTTNYHAGDLDEAAINLRHAIALAPHHANARSCLGLVLLTRGDFAEGWDEYEWRLRSSERTGPRFPQLPWQGGSLPGKHIYVQAEQGFGDTLQFARYLPLLAARAGAVTLRVQQELVTLLRESFSGIAILGDRGEPVPYDCDAALLSLPRLLRTRLETIPGDIGYLRVPATTARHWQQRLATLSGLKIGLCWAGNPDHSNDFRRSIDLGLLAPLLTVPSASFASLQFGKRAADLKKANRRGSAIEDLSPELGDFEQTAGAVMALDLVITVDTSVAHLAAALGKPTWLLVPWTADWRWMLEREDTPWYPTMRLFRQRRGQDWAEVVARVAAKVGSVINRDKTLLTPFREIGEQRAARAAAIIKAEATLVDAVPPVPAMTPGQALVLAEQKRHHNFLGDADDLARQALAAEPKNAEALHTLALVAHQSGKLAEAIAHLERAVVLRPEVSLYHANLGEMYRMAGRVDDAITAGRRAMALDPGNAGAHSNVGIALFDQGRYEEAIACYRRAIELQPGFAQAHSNCGNALQRLKRFAEAEPCYRHALDLQPDFADGWNNLGTCLRESGRLDEAETAYRRALALQPHNTDALDNLALALKDLGRYAEAADTIRRALAIDPTRDQYHVHHAAILLDQGKIEAASEAAGRAMALNPNGHDAANLVGRLAFERGDLDAALAHYRHALALKPDLADAYNNMGNALKETGRMREAQDAYLAAIRIDPDMTGAYVNLADTKTFAPGDVHLAAMEALAARRDGSTVDRMQLGFGLAKAYADLKDHRRSFAHLREANALKRGMVPYREQETLAFFARIEAVFTAELLRDKAALGDPSPVPIFIIGMPRSGTTLVEQILASHPAVHGAGELKAFSDVAMTSRGRDGSESLYPNYVPALDAAALGHIAARYLGEVRKLAPHGERITDKMPSNYYFAGLIHLALPNAVIIHCVRDPVDTCVSCFSKLFSAEQVHTYDLGELGRYYRRYERLMAHWRSVLPQGRMLKVRYEDVVADLEGQARRLVAHCGLAWDERCLSFHTTDRPVRTASATQVRQPIYRSAIGRWRAYEAELGPLLAALAG